MDLLSMILTKFAKVPKTTTITEFEEGFCEPVFSSTYISPTC